ncbi:MAG: hypothetical protein JSS70_06990 [Bacteroidetes bacterium]|nr:hypothetical protein [Bacteroidota bacterium]
MKRLLLLLLIVLGLYTQAQVYNNEWIDYNKTYYKFKVGATGLYRISQPVLAGVGLGSVPAEQFQLWRNGQQVPIYVSVPSGALGNSDYIEFWGEMNDGKPDNVLYRNPDYQLNDKWSLQTDTAAFFLTVNPAGGNFQFVNTVNDLAGNTLAPEPYFIYTAGKYYRDQINAGYAASVGEYVYSASYDMGEGWTSVNISATNSNTAGTPLTFGFNNLHLFSGGPDPSLRVHVSGNAINPRIVRLKVNSDSIMGQEVDYFDYAKMVTTFPIGKLSTDNASIEVANLSNVNTDRLVVHKIELTYPKQFNFDGQPNYSFSLPANANGNYLEISNFLYGSTAPILYDLTNGKSYVTDISNPSLVRVLLQPSSVDRNLLLVSEDPSQIRQVTALQQRNFVNYALSGNQGNYVIISHKNLFTSSDGTNYVESYRAYRSSPEGGGYTAKIYDIDELVDQFGLGIKKHPLSIRNFLMWARATYSLPLKDVFLIGHGLTYTQYRGYESTVGVETLNMVPTFGNPASDMLLSSTPSNPIPQTPIGRLSVINGNEIASYFQKVKDFEAAQAFSSPASQDKAWMKNVVHVIGSSDEQLSTMLTDYMNKYKLIISDSLFGANVHTFNKSSTNPVEQLGDSQIPALFKEGISLLLYFGHSSSTALAFNLEDPKNYANTGKYPVMIMLGCNAGNFFNYNSGRFSTYTTVSENFNLTPQRGSIAYFASTHLGIVHYLDIYNTRTYTAISNTFYGKTIGEQIVEAIKQVYNLTTTDDYYARFHVEENTLHGDPAIRINSQPKPDYVIEEPFVRVLPSFISVSKSSFKVNARFINMGRVVNKPIVIEVKRQYPNSLTEVVYRDTIPGIRYADSIAIDLPIVATRDKGVNKITVTVDADNAVDELYETNNSITKDIVIYDDDASPVYPYNYAIINKQNIKLKASTADPFAQLAQYKMEIDTTDLFNSPAKVTQTISSKGGLLEFSPGVVFSDSTVYYWRVAKLPASVTDEPKWNEFSFVYLANSDLGFNQSHYFQHTASTFSRLSIDSTSRKWKFGVNHTSLAAGNTVYPTGGAAELDFSVLLNDTISISGGGCAYDEIIINVLNPNNLKPWVNNYSGATGLYGSLRSVCGNHRINNFEYLLNSSASRKLAMDFLDMVPDGYYVVIKSNSSPSDAGNTYPNVWRSDSTLYGSGNTLYDRLYNQGFADLDSFNRARTFSFIYKKNDAATFASRSMFTQGIYDKINLITSALTPDTLGYVSSPVFGPAKAWKQLKWRGTNAPDASSGDNPVVDLIGVTPDNSEAVLFSGININQQDYDISSVDAKQFPFIKINLRNADSINFSPYQLRYWRLTYEPVPEGALAPNINFQMKDTIDIGEPLDFKVAFKNISEAGFDSLKVKMVITNRNNVPTIIPIPRHNPLAPDSVLNIQYTINTASLGGLNTLYIDVNPDKDQPEQYHFNNFGFREIYVKPDSLNPMLDVTFDGVHILNHDIISAKPNILIKMKDEAKWMILDDTSLVTVQLRYPDGSLKTIHFSNDTLKFTPAGQAPNTNNTATIEFLPHLAQDGEYELIVSGRDKSANVSGKIQYRVSFQVINKAMISNMLNYPNPFTTSTAFVFTVTGSEVPQNIRIQILTITGKIVREITKQELGPIHIGRNITEFKWDGTDQYGQKLANGIYLYRVITNLNGKSLEKYKSESDNTDKYFNKGYGKMYLMR